MRNLILGLSLSVAFIVGCLAGPALQPVVVPPVQAGTSSRGVTKWEYTCYEGTSNLMSTFRTLGQAGWEMASSTGGIGPANFRAYEKFAIWCFKRRLP